MPARRTAGPTLRIATFNVNGIRSRLPHLLQWLEREQPDIACLQELKAVDEGFPIDEIRAAGYGALWHGQRSWNGVAILSRGGDPVESRRGLPGARDDVQSRYLEAAAHGVLVGCLYLPNGNPQPGPKFEYKLAWFDRLIAHAQGLFDSGHPVVLLGDYNVVPTDELDIYDPKHWRKDALLQPESRERWRTLLAQGWTDALRTLHPDEKIFTFWDYFRNHWPRNAGLRIDHVLLNRELAPRLHSAGVDRWVRDLPGASDHAPTWVLLDMAANGARGARKATKGVADKATKQVAKKVAKQVRKPVATTTTKSAAKKATKAVPKKAKKAVPKKATKDVAKKVAKKAAKHPTSSSPRKRGSMGLQRTLDSRLRGNDGG